MVYRNARDQRVRAMVKTLAWAQQEAMAAAAQGKVELGTIAHLTRLYNGFAPADMQLREEGLRALLRRALKGDLGLEPKIRLDRARGVVATALLDGGADE